MIKNKLPIFLAAVFACSLALADEPIVKPLTESELLKQIESLKPARDGAATPSPGATPAAAPNASSVANPSDTLFQAAGRFG